MAAVKAESIPIFEILIEHGWDVNAPLGFGHTPLVNLLHNEKLARWLLAHGADPNLGPPFNAYPRSDPIANSGNTLDIAAAMSSPAFFDFLLRHGTKLKNCAPLHSAVEGMGNSTDGGRIPMMERLLRLTLDINDFDECRGRRIVGMPSHCAIRQGAVDKVRFLLEKGVDTQMNIKKGDSALVLEKENGNEEMIALVESYLHGHQSAHTSFPNDS